MEKDEKDVSVNEDAELDAELESTIAGIKAGNEPQPKVEVKPEETKEETPKTPEGEDPSKPQVEVKKDEYDYRIPNKGKFESDEAFEKRTELMDLVKKRKLAKTDEQRQDLTDQIKTAKSQLKNLNGSDKKIINPLNQVGETPKEEEDETLKADRERLRELGGATKEDIQEIIQQDRLATEVKNTLDTFVDRHSQLKDEDVREVFFDFVEANFNWQGKTGKELMTTLELAMESMFKPSESIQERVIKGANVAEKVNMMQFPGGTISKPALSPEMQKSVDELKATGMSEEKALELLSE